MALFFRIHNNQLYTVAEVQTLGFNMSDPSFIPTEYLEKGEFVLLRTCLGIGDWGILSAMPRMLKEKYPNCKVYLPSDKLMDTIFTPNFKQTWDSWSNPYTNIRYVFDNNPYIDGYVDSVDGEIYHDHFRLALVDEEPLVKQMLRFWQFSEEEMEDYKLFPELYFTEEEEDFGDSIIDQYIGNDGYYGTLLISDRFEDNPEWKTKIQTALDEYGNFPYFYWLTRSDVPFIFERALDIRHIHPRIQLYLKTMAEVNIGIQCCMNDIVAQYATTISVVRGKLGTNIVTCEEYL